MKLYLSPRSPFARRVRLALHRLQFQFEEKILLNVFEHHPDLISANPLGLVPTLITDDGFQLFDSALILEYLDERTGLVFPKNFRSRTEARKACYLAEGIMRNTVDFFIETGLHENPSQRWANDYLGTIIQALAAVSNSHASLWQSNGQLTTAGWDLAVALEYLEFRIPSLEWSKHFPQGVEILHLARKSEFFQKTKPVL